jgi:hypothetical protein
VLAIEDFGEEIARWLAPCHRRGGGQSQFSLFLELKIAAGRFGPLLAKARTINWLVAGCLLC